MQLTVANDNTAAVELYKKAGFRSEEDSDPQKTYAIFTMEL